MRHLERAMFDVIHEHIRSLNLSYFMFDLSASTVSVGIQLEQRRWLF